MSRLTTLLIAAICFAATPAIAQGLYDFSDIKDGITYLRIDKSGSTISVREVTVLKPILGPNTPEDPQDPVTQPNRIDKFNKVVAAIDDPEPAKNLMALYQGLSQKCLPPNPSFTTPQELEKAASLALNLFLNNTSTKAQAWQPFRDLLNAEWIKVAQEGGGMDAYATLLSDVSKGLAVASNSENAEFNMAAIFSIIEVLIDPSLSRIQKVAKIIPLIISLFAK